LEFQFADVQARPHVTFGVAKGVAKETPLHIVQSVKIQLESGPDPTTLARRMAHPDRRLNDAD
jgi:hypothetical protein